MHAFEVHGWVINQDALINFKIPICQYYDLFARNHICYLSARPSYRLVGKLDEFWWKI